MAGPLKTLYGALKASSFLSGVTLVFGDEETNTQRWGLPCIVMIARGGPYQAPGYALNLDPYTESLWEKSIGIDFYLWASSTDPANQGAIDHSDAIESLEALLMSALQDQRAQYADLNNVAYGLVFKAASSRWETVGQNAVSKYGRTMVVNVQFAFPVVMTAIPGGPEATITSTQQTPQFIDQPSG